MSVTRRKDCSRGFRCRVALGLGSALLLGLSACGSGGEPVAQSSTTQTAPTPSNGSSPQRFQSDSGKSPDGGKSSAAGKFKGALHRLLAGDSDPSREQIGAALKSAGFDPQDVEISNDTTPTGLEVDAMEAAVRVGGKCLVAQLRGGETEVTTLPVLATGHCFVGDQR